MTSEAKVAANRRNAQSSTGPRSTAGKARSRRNALRHGLAIPISADAVRATQIAALAEALAGGGTELSQQMLAHAAAQAQLEIERLQQAKTDVLERAARKLEPATAPALSEVERMVLAFERKSKLLATFARYERRALSRRKRAIRALTDLAHLRPGPQLADRQARFQQLVARLDVPALVQATQLARADAMGAVQLACELMSSPGCSLPAQPTIKATLEFDDSPVAVLRLEFNAAGGERVRQAFVVEAVANRVGRAWLAYCPESKALVRHLYLAMGETRLRSRQALRLTYRSKLHNEAEREAVGLGAILHQLGAHEASDPLQRPARMPQDTFARLSSEVKAIRYQLTQRTRQVPISAEHRFRATRSLQGAADSNLSSTISSEALLIAQVVDRMRHRERQRARAEARARPPKLSKGDEFKRAGKLVQALGVYQRNCEDAYARGRRDWWPPTVKGV
jgi:hypothetical protein